MTNKTVLIDLDDCLYNKENKTLTVHQTRVGYVSLIRIRSARTGAIIDFAPIKEDDPLFDHDGWDGEMAIYRPTKTLSTVDRLIVTCLF